MIIAHINKQFNTFNPPIYLNRNRNAQSGEVCMYKVYHAYILVIRPNLLYYIYMYYINII